MGRGNENKEISIEEFNGKPTINDVKNILISNIKFNWIERKISFLRNKKIQIYLNKNLEKEYTKLLCQYEDNQYKLEKHSIMDKAKSRLYNRIMNDLINIIDDNLLLKEEFKSLNINILVQDSFNKMFNLIKDNMIEFEEQRHILFIKEMNFNEKVDYICKMNYKWMFEKLKKNVIEKEYKRLVLNNEAEKIKITNICKERKINSLVHFTNIKNLTSILMNGIIPIMFQDEYEISSEINDIKRIDDHLECTSFSIEFPNYRFFYNLRYKNKEKSFVIIKINHSVLWNKYRSFCIHNAADARILTKDKYSLSKASEFNKMFDNIGSINREILNIPCNYTTDPQAEVLVEGYIDVKYIEEIIFENYNDYNTFIKNNDIKSNIKFRVDSRYFSPRSDYNHWRKDT